ncbi:MAG: helix-turn-helix transcriptional regulator, partial [Bacteroides sp.]|nr:helix-turn-helix transcriptional regulator [Bacteroides sp.]
FHYFCYHKTHTYNMETADKKERNTHHGHAIKWFRRALGIKQDTVALTLGLTQAAISMYEAKKVIEDEMITQFAKALGVTPEAIKELEEDPVTVIVENNTFQSGSVGNIGAHNEVKNENFGNIYNPVEEILNLTKEKESLYERMLELEKEKNALLERLLKEKN